MREKLDSRKKPSNGEILFSLIPEIEHTFLNRFLALSDEIQRNIIADLKVKKQDGTDTQEILHRLHILIKGGDEFSRLNGYDSDMYPSAHLTIEELKLKEDEGRAVDEADKILNEPVEELVERMERKDRASNTVSPNIKNKLPS